MKSVIVLSISTKSHEILPLRQNNYHKEDRGCPPMREEVGVRLAVIAIIIIVTTVSQQELSMQSSSYSGYDEMIILL